MSNRVALLIGGNQGDRHALLQKTTVLIRQRIGTVVQMSAVYETAPWGCFEPDASMRRPPDFLNQALLVSTDLSAHEVMEEALLIEAVLGRLRPDKPDMAMHDIAEVPQRVYRSRPMDIDLIFFNDEVIDTPDLTIPHPRAHQRRFVLEPLCEIMPDFTHPVLHKTMKQLLDEV